MKTKQEDDEIIKEDEEESRKNFAFIFYKYKVYVNRRQWSVYDSTKESTNPKTGKVSLGELMGYHRSAPDAVEQIHDIEERYSALNSKTLEGAVQAMREFNKEFNKKLEEIKSLITP